MSRQSELCAKTITEPLQNGQGSAKSDKLGMPIRAYKGKIIQSAIWTGNIRI